ncbi:MAG TPA: LPS export ABC transporter periplasmic protein LptC [Leucothrix mucor]|nr:LPS export ABC transporter periplasmic protein LptC [Leucothrix mucor]
MNRKGLLLLIISIAIAISSIWVNNFWISYKELASEDNEKQIDYYLSDFSLLQTASTGEIKYYMQGQHLTHKNATGGSKIFQPIIQILDSDGKILFIEAKKASQEKSQGNIELSGSVLIKKTETHSSNPKFDKLVDADFTLKTNELSFDPVKRELFTDTSITLITKDGLLTGTGLHSKLDQQELRILSNVHAKFDPSP